MSVSVKASLPTLVGSDLCVPLATGGTSRYINLDAAASTPAMRPVVDAVQEVLPWYASVHRGAGFASQVSTRLYEGARSAVAAFVGARPSDTVVITRNTTDALNHVAHCLPIPAGHGVLSTIVEHHANMLPFRRVAPVRLLPAPASPEALLETLRRGLEDRSFPVAVVTITGASNVTGEVFPLAEIATIVHEHDAILVVDAAQLAPHRAIDMAALGIDCLALSGHKMYAPFGAGALVAPTALLQGCAPFLAGGGAVDFVTEDDVVWTTPPDRLEAGSPNVLGAVAMGVAANTLAAVGMEVVAAHERSLLDRLEARLEKLSRVRRYRLWSRDIADHVGVVTFTVEGMHHALVAAILSAEYAIGVRHGCFCAHPYITQLVGISEQESVAIRERIRHGQRAQVPGAIRASFNIGTGEADVDAFADALEQILRHGPQLQYRQDEASGDFHALTDSRQFPHFSAGIPLAGEDHGAGCGRF